jgi:ABC-type transporter Mla MlaB component
MEPKNRYSGVYGVDKAGFSLLFSFLRHAICFFCLLIQLVGNVFGIA